MKRSIGVVLLLVFGYLPRGRAQEIATPKIELYGGYDFVRYNANPRINGVSSSESFSANGISGQAVYNANNRFGIVGELSGYRLARTGRDTTYQVSYLFGPRVSLKRHVVTPFAQVLFGGVWAADGVTLGPGERVWNDGRRRYRSPSLQILHGASTPGRILPNQISRRCE